MKKILITIIIILFVAFMAFKYFTRPIKIDDISTPLTKEETNPKKSINSEYYQINQNKSSLKFSIDETLNGKPSTPEGESNQIYGGIIFNRNSGELSVGSNNIQIDARTFKTDNPQRDGAINRFILKTTTEGNQYITFKLSRPVKFNPDLSEQNVTVAGTLAISGVTQSINFPITIKKVDDTLLISFKTNIKRSDYDLKIPNIPFVANVSDEFTLRGDIVAQKK